MPAALDWHGKAAPDDSGRFSYELFNFTFHPELDPCRHTRIDRDDAYHGEQPHAQSIGS